MKHRFGTMSARKKAVIDGSILIYILLLMILLLPAQRDADHENKAVFGSTEGRFLSDIVMEHDGETYYYRENEITNYLVIGLDRENINKDAGYQNGVPADFLVILSIDRMNKTITPVMLDHNTMSPVQTYDVFGHPSGTQVMQLRLAQACSGVGSSGSRNTVEAVENLMHGIKIDHYIILNISAIPLLNDAIGGAEVTLQDDFTIYDSDMIKGATARLSSFLSQLRQKNEAASELTTELMGILSEHVRSDASQDILLRDMSAYDDYLWQPSYTLQGSYTIDEYGYAEFWVNDDALQKLVLELWFAKKEPQ